MDFCLPALLLLVFAFVRAEAYYLSDDRDDSKELQFRINPCPMGCPRGMVCLKGRCRKRPPLSLAAPLEKSEESDNEDSQDFQFRLNSILCRRRCPRGTVCLNGMCRKLPPLTPVVPHGESDESDLHSGYPSKRASLQYVPPACLRKCGPGYYCVGDKCIRKPPTHARRPIHSDSADRADSDSQRAAHNLPASCPIVCPEDEYCVDDQCVSIRRSRVTPLEESEESVLDSGYRSYVPPACLRKCGPGYYCVGDKCIRKPTHARRVILSDFTDRADSDSQRAFHTLPDSCPLVELCDVDQHCVDGKCVPIRRLLHDRLIDEFELEGPRRLEY